jgi:hypothetical protein
VLQQKPGWMALQWEEAELLAAPAMAAWVLSPEILVLLGKMAHDCLVSICTVPGCIGVGEAIEGVAVAGFDGIKPSLLDRKAQAGMINSNQGTNTGDIKAAWVKWGTSGLGSQGNSLGCTVQVVDQTCYPGSAGGQDALAGTRMVCSRH